MNGRTAAEYGTRKRRRPAVQRPRGAAGCTTRAPAAAAEAAEAADGAAAAAAAEDADSAGTGDGGVIATAIAANHDAEAPKVVAPPSVRL